MCSNTACTLCIKFSEQICENYTPQKCPTIICCVLAHESLTLHFQVSYGSVVAVCVISYTAVVIGIGHSDVEDGEVRLPLPCAGVIKREAVLGGVGNVDRAVAFVP